MRLIVLLLLLPCFREFSGQSSKGYFDCKFGVFFSSVFNDQLDFKQDAPRIDLYFSNMIPVMRLQGSVILCSVYR